MDFSGNDLVCLAASVVTEKHLNIPWLNKNFNPKELDYINGSANPAIALWKLWSCKESAYKVIVKKTKRRFLNPKKIKIEFTKEKEKLSKVIYQDNELWVKTNINEKYIHSLCSFSLESIDKTECEIIPNNYQTISESSSSIRKALREKISAKYEIKGPSFSKNKLGIPKVNVSNASLDLDISFSHDGLFSAYSFIERN